MSKFKDIDISNKNVALALIELIESVMGDEVEHALHKTRDFYPRCYSITVEIKEKLQARKERLLSEYGIDVQ